MFRFKAPAVEKNVGTVPGIIRKQRGQTLGNRGYTKGPHKCEMVRDGKWRLDEIILRMFPFGLAVAIRLGIGR